MPRCSYKVQAQTDPLLLAKLAPSNATLTSTFFTSGVKNSVGPDTLGSIEFVDSDGQGVRVSTDGDALRGESARGKAAGAIAHACRALPVHPSPPRPTPPRAPHAVTNLATNQDLSLGDTATIGSLSIVVTTTNTQGLTVPDPSE